MHLWDSLVLKMRSVIAWNLQNRCLKTPKYLFYGQNEVWIKMNCYGQLKTDGVKTCRLS